MPGTEEDREEILQFLLEKLGPNALPLMKLDTEELRDLERSLHWFEIEVRCDAQDKAEVFHD